MEASRQQLEAIRVNQGTRPVLEEFIPIKNVTSESSEKPTNISDKANWMTSAQLWSQTTEGTKQQPAITSPKETTDNNIGFKISPKPVIENKHRNGGGAFLPFSKERQAPSTLRPLPELALASNEKQSMEDKLKHGETEKGKKENNSSNDGGEGSPAQTTTSTNTNNSNQTHRKARRCWSPDLHRRFVNALQMLGGSQGTKTITT